jgi:hypothetical protein
LCVKRKETTRYGVTDEIFLVIRRDKIPERPFRSTATAYVQPLNKPGQAFRGSFGKIGRQGINFDTCLYA